MVLYTRGIQGTFGAPPCLIPVGPIQGTSLAGGRVLRCQSQYSQQLASFSLTVAANHVAVHFPSPALTATGSRPKYCSTAVFSEM